MPEIRRAELFGKLHPIPYRAIESATVFCKSRGNPYVELVHWIHQLVQLPSSDLHDILVHYDVDLARLAADLTHTLDQLPRGSTAISDLAAHIEESVERGWVYATLCYGTTRVRSGHLLEGIVRTPQLRRALLAISQEFRKLPLDTDDLVSLCNNSAENGPHTPLDPSSPGESSQALPASGDLSPGALGKGEALARFTVDLTARAASGAMDPIVGRDPEIRQIIDILLRRRQNNPILTGEAGVGKTAVAEGFAQRVANNEVPERLRGVRVLSLDIGLLQAGASMKGEFEQRLRQLIDEVAASEDEIVLFIDEAHTLVGAGGAAGTGDAANLLKPALARGTLRTIAATTWAEYKKHIEKDPALTRRFQVVAVDEPDEERATQMLRAISGVMQEHHQVDILEEALRAAVQLSRRYIPDRQLPDKGVSLLDTACARVALTQSATPATLEVHERRAEALRNEIVALSRDHSIGFGNGERERQLQSELEQADQEVHSLSERWHQEKSAVARILQQRGTLRGNRVSSNGASPDGDVDPEEQLESDVGQAADHGADGNTEVRIDANEIESQRAELLDLQRQLQARQGDSPLVLPQVDAHAVAAVVSDWTGVPVGRMVRDEIDTVLTLPQHLRQRVMGQDAPLEAIARRVRTSRAGIDHPNKPVGVFLLAGPSGVGKTETALALGELLYGGEHNVITINMSEFQEAHTVSTLKGAPPGYVGYGEGGVLTEAVRRKPYSVVLLDEVEKAHSDVHEIFFQVFDKGVMEDGEGRVVDFKNTLILLTSNVGSDTLLDLCPVDQPRDSWPDNDTLADALRHPLRQVFPDAFLGRLTVIPYRPLDAETLQQITRLQLTRVQQRVTAAHGIPFSYDDSLLQHIVERCQQVESGGRLIDAFLTQHLLPEISITLLESLRDERRLERVHVRVEDGELNYEFSAESSSS